MKDMNELKDFCEAYASERKEDITKGEAGLICIRKEGDEIALSTLTRGDVFLDLVSEIITNTVKDVAEQSGAPTAEIASDCFMNLLKRVKDILNKDDREEAIIGKIRSLMSGLGIDVSDVEKLASRLSN